MNAPDLIVHNGKITTLDPARPQVSTVAVSGGRITATGGEELLASANGKTVCVDLKGRRVIPGYEDPASPDVQTFNPLFPKGAYFSEAGLIGPANFIDLDPSLDLQLTKRVTFIVDWDFFWRESTSDGLYNNAVALVKSGTASDARYIGSMLRAQLLWDIDRHLTFAAIYGHFFAGQFLKETGSGIDVDFVANWLTYKF